LNWAKIGKVFKTSPLILLFVNSEES